MWLRARFHANYEDYRPIKFPPPGPYWCTGFSGNEDYSVVVAYIKNENQIFEYWPEADNIYLTEVEEIKFSDRFRKPDWWENV